LELRVIFACIFIPFELFFIVILFIIFIIVFFFVVIPIKLAFKFFFFFSALSILFKSFLMIIVVLFVLSLKLFHKSRLSSSVSLFSLTLPFLFLILHTLVLFLKLLYLLTCKWSTTLCKELNNPRPFNRLCLSWMLHPIYDVLKGLLRDSRRALRVSRHRCLNFTEVWVVADRHEKISRAKLGLGSFNLVKDVFEELQLLLWNIDLVSWTNLG
jgi:hypothetical protein